MGQFPARHPWLWLCFSFIVIWFPQWAASVWSLFSTEPLVVVVSNKLHAMTIPTFSPYWITIPLGLAMFAYLIYELRCQRRQSSSVSVDASKLYPEPWIKIPFWKRKRYKPAIDPRPPSLLNRFQNDFSTCAKVANQLSVSLHDGRIHLEIPWQVCIDSDAGTKFVVFYLPRSPHTYDVCVLLADAVNQVLDHARSNVGIISKSPGDATHVDAKDFNFSGRVFLYHEDLLSLAELGSLETLYRSKNLFPQFRGSMA
jgi:hypothetical protein